jgi:hypothetical protein
MIAVVCVSLVIILFAVKWLQGIRCKMRLIELLPGPTSFSFLLGNIPLEIVGHIGANFEDSKDLYHSELNNHEKFFFIAFEFLRANFLCKPSSE